MATPRSLSNRLRQHSRRSGFAVGASMALAIAVCIAGFVTIYVQLQPYISDFVTQDPPEEESRVAAAANPTEPPADDAEQEEAPAPTEAPAEPDEDAADEEEAPPQEDEPEPTEESSGFNPDFQILGANQSVNLRSGPSVASEVVVVLFATQPLQFLDETVVSENPGPDQLTQGQEWWRFRTEAGEEGYVREIDVEAFEE